MKDICVLGMFAHFVMGENFEVVVFVSRCEGKEKNTAENRGN